VGVELGDTDDEAQDDGQGRVSAGGHSCILGHLCQEAGEIDRAREAYERAIGFEDPEWSVVGRFSLAQMLAAYGDERGAERLLGKDREGEQLTPDQGMAVAAAAIWQLEQDQRAVLAPKVQTGASESLWARAGRLEALRRNE